VNASQAPHLSVLIPFFHDDPSPLLMALAKGSNTSIEILIYDDGTQDTTLTQRLQEAVTAAQCPATLLTASQNKGRSYGRNHMTDYFLDHYMAQIKANTADIIFGGFKVLETRGDASTELHRVMSITSDCASAAERQALGPKNVASSNLCVRKTVLIQIPFDNEFTGWGWEDSEWAARASQSFTLLHIDNPALHLGLETTDTLLKRFKTSGHNYARFTAKHPDIAKSLPLYRWIQRLKTIPGQSLLRPLLKAAVKLRIMPMSLRINALKLWRASWYVDMS